MQDQQRPNNLDPHAWALWNQHTADALSEGRGLPRHQLDEEPIVIDIVEMPPSITSLMLVVRRAASELEGQGEKSDRIALQLITALAAVEQEIG